MTIYKIRYIAAILFIISPFVAFAQQQAGDSISIFELIDAVEKNTSCRIYTTIAEPFKVKKAETLKPTAESLQHVIKLLSMATGSSFCLKRFYLPRLLRS